MKLKNFFIAGLFFLGLCIPFAFNIASAASGACPSDYYGFILNVKSENTRNELLKDLFLPYCQLNDILKLSDELNDLRNTFRSAAFQCENTADYKAKYHEILMEMYFVRHVQESKSDVINEKDAEKLKALKATKLEKLKGQMKEIFVVQENRVNEVTLDKYFTDWSNKYDDRIASYSHCDEGPWAELSKPWVDFLETLMKIQDLKSTIKNPETKSLKDILSPEVGVDADEDMSALGKSLVKAWEYLKKEEDVAKTEVPDSTTLGDLSGSGESYTFEAALNAIIQSESTYDFSMNGVDRMQRYKMLYGYGGANSATDMQGILEALNRLLAENNSKDFPYIESLLSKVYDKQCN